MINASYFNDVDLTFRFFAVNFNEKMNISLKPVSKWMRQLKLRMLNS